MHYLRILRAHFGAISASHKGGQNFILLHEKPVAVKESNRGVSESGYTDIVAVDGMETDAVKFRRTSPGWLYNKRDGRWEIGHGPLMSFWSRFSLF